MVDQSVATPAAGTGGAAEAPPYELHVAGLILTLAGLWAGGDHSYTVRLSPADIVRLAAPAPNAMAERIRDLAAGLQDGSIKGPIGHNPSTYARMEADAADERAQILERYFSCHGADLADRRQAERYLAYILDGPDREDCPPLQGATATSPSERARMLDAVGEVIASKMKHDSLDVYRRERELFAADGPVDREAPGYRGTYEGCVDEAKSFVERLRTRGFDVVTSPPERVAGGAGLPTVEEMAEALRPFGQILKGNLHFQHNDMRLSFGPNDYDLRFACTVGDLRRTAAILARLAPSQDRTADSRVDAGTVREAAHPDAIKAALAFAYHFLALSGAYCSARIEAWEDGTFSNAEHAEARRDLRVEQGKHAELEREFCRWWAPRDGFDGPVRALDAALDRAGDGSSSVLTDDQLRDRLFEVGQPSLREWCRVHGVNSAHANEFSTGVRGPGSDLLKALGVQRAWVPAPPSSPSGEAP